MLGGKKKKEKKKKRPAETTTTSALQSYSGFQLTAGFQGMTARIVWQILVARNSSHQAEIHKPGGLKDPAPQQTEDSVEESHWGLQPNPRSHLLLLQRSTIAIQILSSVVVAKLVVSTQCF